MINVAIDGPSAAGKSQISRLVAKEMNYVYIDTGAMFRSLGLKALETIPNPFAECFRKRPLTSGAKTENKK